MGNTNIKLAVAGMDHRSQLLFRKMAESHLQGICDLVEVQQADAVLIDMDSENSQEYWDSLKDNYPDLPVIVLSIRPINVKNTMYLRKPIKISSLITSLRILFPNRFLKNQQTDTQVIDAPQDQQKTPNSSGTSVVDVANSINENSNVVSLQANNTKWEWNGEVFDPSVHLISYVKKAITESSALKKISKISLFNDKTIVVNPRLGQVITAMSESMLRSMAIVAIKDEEARLHVETIGSQLPDAFNPQKNTSLKVYKTDAFLWMLAISTARGRMPLEVGDSVFYPDKPVFMQHWPNLTRLEAVPYAQQITALLTSHPRPLGEVASLLNIDIKHVINLFYASALIGNAGQARRPADKLFAAMEPEKAKNPGILSAIMKKLRSMNTTKAQSA
jgi:hypothetical protein